jgi:hypothetical protein
MSMSVASGTGDGGKIEDLLTERPALASTLVSQRSNRSIREQEVLGFKSECRLHKSLNELVPSPRFDAART